MQKRIKVGRKSYMSKRLTQAKTRIKNISKVVVKSSRKPK